MSADALLPGGPYDLWQQGQTGKRIKVLVGAFAQVPKLPKVLRRGEIIETLVDGDAARVFRAAANEARQIVSNNLATGRIGR